MKTFIASVDATMNNSYLQAIIDNDGTDTVVGAFSGLTEDATFTLGDAVLRISYSGDGNNVVPSVVSVPASPDTGLGLLTARPLHYLLQAAG